MTGEACGQDPSIVWLFIAGRCCGVTVGVPLFLHTLQTPPLPPLCSGPYRCPPQLSHSFLFSPCSSIFNPLTFRLEFRDHPAGGSRTLLRLADHQVNRFPPPPPPPAVEAVGRFSSLILASYQHRHRASETEDGLPSILWSLDCFPKLTEENGDVHWHFPSVKEPSWLSRKIIWTSVCVKSSGSFHRRDLHVLCFALQFKYRLKVSLQGLITIKSPAAANNLDDADQIHASSKLPALYFDSPERWKRHTDHQNCADSSVNSTWQT